MRTRYAFATLVLTAWLASTTLADQINLKNRKGAKLGTVRTRTPSEVVIESASKKAETIPVNLIDSIQYTGQPPEMNLLFSDLRNRNFNSANNRLDRLAASKVSSAAVRDDLTYYRAYVTACLRMESGAKPTELKEARDRLLAYVKQNPTSWHLYQAVETLGDLMLSIAPGEPETNRPGAYAEAIKHYEQLAQAPWDDYKMRSAIARGRVHRQAGQLAAATAAYKEAIALGKGKEADALIAPQLLLANVGLADTQSESNPAEGIKLINGVIKDADPEDQRLHAMAFLTIGKCYEKTGDVKKALFNFLKVELVYYRYPEYRAEALYHLQRVWGKVNEPTRAREAGQTLKEQYPGSAWTRKLAANP